MLHRCIALVAITTLAASASSGCEGTAASLADAAGDAIEVGDAALLRDGATPADGTATDAVAADALAPARPADIEDNIWSWWVHPLAVNDGDVSWVGGIAKSADVRITRVNADASLEPVVVGRTVADDHNGPAIALAPDREQLVVFFAAHGSEKVVHYRTLHRQSLALGAARELSFSGSVTYAQLLVHGDRLVLVTRVADSTWRYRISEDFGGAWSEERILVDARGLGKVYCLVKPVRSAPATAHLAFYGHPTGSTFRKVQHGTIHLDDGRVTVDDGAVVGDLDAAGGPSLNPDALDTAISPSTGWVVRLLDVGELGGMPAILYAVWQGDAAARYRVKLRRAAGEWSSAPWTADTGAVFGYTAAIHYHGGAVFAHGDEVVTSREVSGQWEIQRWSWDAASQDLRTGPLLSTSSRPVVRPYVPYRAGRVDLIAHELLQYDGYTDFRADTRFLAP